VDGIRLLSWNCNMAFRKKQQYVIARFNPDIMVIQECEEPGKFSNLLDSHYNILWTGENKNKGLAIFSKKNLQIESLPVDCSNIRYMLSIKLASGHKIIAFWAMDDKQNRLQRYIGQVWTGLNNYLEHLDSKTIIVGDFNGNVIWDRPGKLAYPKMRDVIELLKKYQIESAYHFLNGEEFGEEAEMTFYLYKNSANPYHIDYIFAPGAILTQARQFGIGQYDHWIQQSDHMPLWIEF
jgi:exodeoxyribonuclease-3